MEKTTFRVEGNKTFFSCGCKTARARWATRFEQQHNRRDTSTFPKKGTRICARCKIEKPFTDFHRDRTDSQGHGYVCKECKKKKAPNEGSK